MEIEEDRDLIDKKASKDHFTDFGQFYLGAPSLSILSLIPSQTQSILLALYHWRKEGKGRTREQKGSKDQVGKTRIKQL